MIFFILLGISVILGQEVSYSGHKLVRFNVNDKKELASLESFVKANRLDAWNELRVGSVDIRFNPQQAKQLNATGIKYDIVNDDIQKLFNNEKFAKRSGQFTESYHSVEEIYKWLGDINYNNATVFEIGKSYEKRPIKGISFGNPKKPTIFYNGGIHAREWISPATILYLIDAFNTDKKLKDLLNTFHFSFIPVVNVDGYTYSRNVDRLWRHNRMPNRAGTCVGTDLNRNFDIKWETSSDVCSEIYAGAKPFSSPESKALAIFMKNNNIINYIDFHAYSQLWMSPYGYDCNKIAKDFKIQDNLAKKAVAAIQSTHRRNYEHGAICNVIYKANGLATDWAYEKAGIKYSYAVELPDKGQYGFALPPRMITSVGQEILAAVKVLASGIKETEKL